MQWQNSHALKSNPHDSWGKHSERLCWNTRHKGPGHLVWEVQGRAPGLGRVWEQLHETGQPLALEGERFQSLPSPLAASLQDHTSCRSGLPLSPNPGPCPSLNFTGASCSPRVPRAKGRSLVPDQAFPHQPLPAMLHPQQFQCPAGEDTGMVALMDISRVCGKVPRVQVGKSIGDLIFQDVARLLRIPSLFSGYVLNRRIPFYISIL